MRGRIGVEVVMALALCATTALAISPSTEVWIPAASRIVVTDAFWTTDLTLVNPGQTVASVDVYWLDRGESNADAMPVRYTIQPGATVQLDDVILSVFGREQAEGAIRVTSTVPVIATATVSNQTAGGLFGQGFEGVPGSVAITASGSEFALNDSRQTVIAGIEQNGQFRSNVFAVGVDPAGSVVDIEVLNDRGGVIDRALGVELGPWEPWFTRVEALTSSDEAAAIRAQIVSGAAIVVGSKIERTTGDPITLESSYNSCQFPNELPVPGIYRGIIVHPQPQQPGYEFGFTMSVSSAGDVEQMRFVHQGDTDCPYQFVTDTEQVAIPLEEFFTGGATFAVDYSEGGAMLGTVTYTVELEMAGENPAVFGRVVSVGSGFSDWLGVDATACNGPHEQHERVELGFLPR